MEFIHISKYISTCYTKSLQVHYYKKTQTTILNTHKKVEVHSLHGYRNVCYLGFIFMFVYFTTYLCVKMFVHV